jgi:hypothetical protein
MRVSILTILLTVIFINVFSQHSKNVLTLKDTLWNRVSIDTFPYLKTHEGMSRLATNSSLVWLFGGRNNLRDTIGNNLAIMQAYYYNLLAKRYNLADTIAIIAESQFPDANTNMQGHYGLRRYVPCFGLDTDSCRKERYLALQYMDYAEQFSTIMPTYHWKWLAQQLRGRLPFQEMKVLKPLNDGLSSLSSPSWEGASIAFSRKPGSVNLLLSNGARYPLQVLEWSDSLQTWSDVTTLCGLDNFPGGHRIYKVDYNLDGYDDLLILRKSSTSKSPAKYFPSLLRNNRKGGYDDMTTQARLQDIERANCACWDDINEDGLPDVFLGNEFSPSYWMVQDSNGTFSNKALGYGIQTIKEIVTDCALIDINEDGMKDLYLSIRDGNNRMYVQSLLEGGFRFFYDQTADLGMINPKMMAHTLVYDHNGDGKEDLIVIPDISDRSDMVSQLMSRDVQDKAEAAKVYYTQSFQKALPLKSDTLSSFLPLMRAGLLLRTGDGYEWIYGGGNATESLLPMIFVKNGLDSMQIQTPDNWPAYVHSAAAWPSREGNPRISFKGGGQYPFLINRQSGYTFHHTGGQFIRLVIGDMIPVGTKVSYFLTAPDGQTKSHTLHLQATDSKGFNALQEWIWLPDGYRISEVNAERYIERKVDVVKKKKKRKKIRKSGN